MRFVSGIFRVVSVCSLEVLCELRVPLPLLRSFLFGPPRPPSTRLYSFMSRALEYDFRSSKYLPDPQRPSAALLLVPLDRLDLV